MMPQPIVKIFPLAAPMTGGVPTRKEYATMLNLGRLSPSLDTTYFPYFTATAT